MNPNANKSFFDKNTLLAMLLVFGFFVLWQRYMESRYPQLNEKQPEVVEKPVDIPTASSPGTVTNEPEPTEEESGDLPIQVVEKTFPLEFATYVTELSNYGMGLGPVRLAQHTDREGNSILIGDARVVRPFSTFVNGIEKPLVFDVRRQGEYQYIGTASFQNYRIDKTVTFYPDRYAFDVRVEVSGVDRAFPGLVTYVGEELRPGAKSFLIPTYEHQDYFFLTDGSEEREILELEEGARASQPVEVDQFGNVSVAAITSQYFALALLDESQVLPSASVRVLPEQKTALMKLSHIPVNVSGLFEVSYKGFVGPKDVELLENIDSDLARIVDFGFFSFLARPLLKLLKWFNTFLNNWGLAIIVLTLLVRMILLPFNITSYKSMKKMQKIQEPMKELRERYKEDPQKMNQEVMALMKREGANPLGGCLPMLLQMPIFFALYQVLGKSIELYKAPFAFWIQDLSARDP